MYGRYGVFAMLLFGLFGRELVTPNDPSWKATGLIASFIIARTFTLPLFVSFFLNFPVRRKILDRKSFLPALYIINAALVAILVFNQKLTIPLPVLLFIVNILPIVFFLAGLIIFVHSYFAKVEKSRRKHLRPILLGVGIGIVILLYFGIVSTINPYAKGIGLGLERGPLFESELEEVRRRAARRHHARGGESEVEEKAPTLS